MEITTATSCVVTNFVLFFFRTSRGYTYAKVPTKRMLRSPSRSLIRAPWTMTPAPSDSYLDATMAPSRGIYSPSLTENGDPTTYFTPVIDSTWMPPNVNDHYPQSNDPMMTPSASDYPNNSIVVAVLIALICILFLILIFVTVPPILHIIKRKMPVPQARIDRRYATIDGWLIRKVRNYYSFSECPLQLLLIQYSNTPFCLCRCANSLYEFVHPTESTAS